MKKINFDDIHTSNKQQNLQRMMLLAAANTHHIQNNNSLISECPVCDSTEITPYVEKFGYQLYKCSSCSHIFCNPMPSNEQLESYYNSEMKTFENEFFQESFEQRIPIFDYRTNRILEYVKEGKLLDVGSAIGIFIEALTRQKTELKIDCCEPSRDACIKLRQRYPDIQLYENWLQELEKNSYYDAITLWDTLEHIVELDELCSKIFSLLKPGGYWFFSTPNTTSFEWMITGREHVQLLPPGHVNLFNRDNIKTLLEKHKFVIESIETPNGSLDVSYICKMINNSTRFDLTLGHFLKSNLVNESFQSSLAEMLVKERLAGNIFVIARKPDDV